MKNVKHMTTAENNQPSSVAPESGWSEESVLLKDIIQHGPLQVRHRLDKAAVKRYSDMTKAGSSPPPIKVGKVGDKLYLVDGWHRLEAGAVEQGFGFDTVMALVKEMTEDEVRWEAAKANLGHGVPLKTREYRNVFRAFIRAKQHHKGRGRFLSYREMAAALGVGVGHTTLRNWTLTDFPSLARALGGEQEGNQAATQPQVEGLTLEEEHILEAHKALEQLSKHATSFGSPTERWKLLAGLRATAAALESAGVEEPVPEQF
jgi:hypothetical protein